MVEQKFYIDDTVNTLDSLKLKNIRVLDCFPPDNIIEEWTYAIELCSYSFYLESELELNTPSRRRVQQFSPDELESIIINLEQTGYGKSIIEKATNYLKQLKPEKTPGYYRRIKTEDVVSDPIGQWRWFEEEPNTNYWKRVGYDSEFENPYIKKMDYLYYDGDGIFKLKLPGHKETGWKIFYLGDELNIQIPDGHVPYSEDMLDWCLSVLYYDEKYYEIQLNKLEANKER